MHVFEKLSEFRYEQLVFCHDKATGLRAIIAIHDTTLGPALGGCRMWPYGTEDEAVTDVLRLARGMTYKAAASGLNLGGGKSVIFGDPDRDKTEALFRSFGRYAETLGGRYVAAEDVGTSTEDISHIQVETPHVVGVDVTRGGSGDPSPLTALGVVQGMRACARRSLARPPYRIGRSRSRASVTLATTSADSCTQTGRTSWSQTSTRMLCIARHGSSGQSRWNQASSSPSPATFWPLAPWAPSSTMRCCHSFAARSLPGALTTSSLSPGTAKPWPSVAYSMLQTT